MVVGEVVDEDRLAVLAHEHPSARVDRVGSDCDVERLVAVDILAAQASAVSLHAILDAANRLVRLDHVELPLPLKVVHERPRIPARGDNAEGQEDGARHADQDSIRRHG
jgi:hypothetical protein